MSPTEDTVSTDRNIMKINVFSIKVRDFSKHGVTRKKKRMPLLATRRPYSVRFVSAHSPLRDITSLVAGNRQRASGYLTVTFIW